ncbi:sortase domain-containing protein [Nocardioides plantarum]|uniref:Sortase domain-bontaining protein n=2 Tax=Nocardioides plantarum TaxID=29299 RepID=A0ABV5KD54_9ACTN
MSIPQLDIDGLEVQTYRGVTDDAAGHAIQNTGIAASPSGPDGGTGPGGIGNYQVTGHRNSATAIFLRLPELERGDEVLVTAGETVYVYRIATTRITSFRSERSLREQRAAVPGRPGVRATRAMITISTCRTQEDHAEGNFWADELDNPEHRIDKIGVLVRTRPA